MKFVDQESSHHAFVEQFTSVCTKLDHVPGMTDVTYAQNMPQDFYSIK